jgi:hypothetical protein
MGNQSASRFHFAKNLAQCQGEVFIFCRLLTSDSLKSTHQQDADCKPDSVVKNHLSGPGVAAGIKQLTQGIGRESLERPLFSFAPDGVCLSPSCRQSGR